MIANRRFGHLLMVGLSLSVVACGGESLTIPSNTGTLEITTTTSGSVPDPDGYTVQVDAQQPQTIGSGATIQVEGLTPGAHNVLLAGVAANCTVQGNPRTVTIAIGETTDVTFELTCGATTGALEVSTQTTGESADADGYTISFDGTDRGPIGANDGTTLSNLPPGNHVVGLAGIAGNCHVEGDNLRAVAVVNGATASVSFAVTCVALPPEVGTLRITTTTGGPNQDTGYEFAVDGGQTQPIGPNNSITVTSLSAGNHSVALSDVAPNCSVEDGTSKDVTITAGATTTLTFNVTCALIPPTVGDIRVTTSTSGEDQDPDGYAVAVDGGASQAIGRNDATLFPNVAVGGHTVTLSNVAGNCTVSDGPSKDVTVIPGATATVAFTITCVALPPTVGTIRVTTATTGSDLDPNGYTFKVDGGPNHDIGPNETISLNNVAAGSHTVQLTGVADNCSVTNGPSKDIVVTGGATTDVGFAVTCAAIPPSASRSDLSVGDNTIDVGSGSTSVTVTVKDASGKPLSGVAVTPASTGSGNEFTPTSSTTNENGVASFSFRSTVAEDKIISATAGGVLLDDTEEIHVVIRQTSTDIIAIEPDPSTAGETIRVTFTVTAEGGGTPTGGTVEVFSLNEGAGCEPVPVSQGFCDFVLTSPGAHFIEALYSGDAQFEESSDLVTHQVDPAPSTGATALANP